MTINAAIILAAGRGSRLGAYSAAQPKCLTRLAGRSLLDWQSAALREAGIDDITLVAGYRAERLARRRDVRVVTNPDWSRGGPVASLLCADPASYAGGFVVVYGDCIFHPDLIRALQVIPAPIGITSDRSWHDLWSLRFTDVLKDAETLRHANGDLLAIGARASSLIAIEGQFTGLLKFSVRGWHATQRRIDDLHARGVAELDMTTLLAQLLAHGERVGVAPIDGRWCEVDSASDLQLYRRLLRRRCWSHDWRWLHPTPAA